MIVYRSACLSVRQKPGERLAVRSGPRPWISSQPAGSALTGGSFRPSTLNTSRYLRNVSMGQTMAREVMAGSPQTASATDLAAGSVTVLAGYSNPCPRETGPDGLTCSTDSRVTWPASPQTPEVPEPPAVLPHAVRPSARTPAARAPVTCRDALRYLFMLVRRIPEAGGSLLRSNGPA